MSTADIETIADEAAAFVESIDTFAIRGVSSVAVAADRLRELSDFCEACMIEGEDFGRIPGAPKSFLHKPGAEKLAEFYGLAIVPSVVQRVEEWNAEPPLFHYEVRVDLVSKRDGSVQGAGLGSCNSRESKYRWRTAERVCPKCSAAAIISGREEFGGGWVCWKKRGGCGSTFADTDARLVDQTTAQIENPDTADLVNTVLKMAKKRALVDAVLGTVRASNLFTQDEDAIDAQGSVAPKAAPAAPAPPPVTPPAPPATPKGPAAAAPLPAARPSSARPTSVPPPTARRPQARAAAPVASSTGDGSTTIARVDRKPGKSPSGTYTLYTVHAADGTRATTFDDALGELAEAHRVAGSRVHLVTVRNGSFVNVVEITHADVHEPAFDLAEAFDAEVAG